MRTHPPTHPPVQRAASPAPVVACLIAASLLGCSLADPSLYQALPETRDDGGTGRDGDMPPGDAEQDGGGVEQRGVDRCGADDVYVIRNTEEDILIDTRVFTSTVNSLPGSCNVSAPGRDAFFAVDVQAGEYWHFHLRVSPDDPDVTSRNPILYLLNSSCATTQCNRDLFANYCEQNQDEHFGFQFTESGRWYVGVDDANTGGGVYLLDAIRPVCDGVPEHGEACDGDPGCSADCRWILTEESIQEKGFNFNFFESNVVQLPASNELVIEGDIGGFEGCAYPDVFAVTVAAGTRLVVEQLGPDGNPCTGSGAAPLDIAIQNRRGETRGTSTAMNGCAVVDVGFAAAGEFFIVLRDARADRRFPLPYRLRIRND
ncbi:MAG: hypothetical protein KF901_04465 [Myxococcales bacterium]|nr:hypothetical protein [Myxococcales bacterium]